MFSFFKRKEGPSKETDEDFRRLLFLSASYGDSNAVRTVIKAGVAVDVLDENGMSGLLLASRDNPDVDVAKTFIELGADIKKRDREGRSCLMLAAAFNSNPKVAECLLSSGCGMKGTYEDGQDVLMMACSRGLSELVRLLLENGARTEDALLLMAEKGKDTGILRMILSHYEGDFKDAFLLAASRNPEPGITQCFLSMDPGLDVRDSLGRTPLMLALLNDNQEVVSLLLDSGPDLSAKDSQGHGVLDYVQPSLLGSPVFERLFLSYREVNQPGLG